MCTYIPHRCWSVGLNNTRATAKNNDNDNNNNNNNNNHNVNRLYWTKSHISNRTTITTTPFLLFYKANAAKTNTIVIIYKISHIGIDNPAPRNNSPRKTSQCKQII